MTLLAKPGLALGSLAAAAIVGGVVGGSAIKVENNRHPKTVTVTASPTVSPTAVMLMSTVSPMASAPTGISATVPAVVTVSDVMVQPMGTSGLLGVTGTLETNSASTTGAELLATLYDKNGKVLAQGSTVVQHIVAGSKTTFTVTSANFTQDASAVSKATVTVTRAL